MYYAKKFILLLLRAFIILTIFLVMVVSGFIWNKSFRDLVLEKQESLSGYDVSIGSVESSRDFLSIKNFRVSKAQREIVKGDEIYLYYGGADKVIGLATANLDQWLQYLKKECRH